ncbi:MAG: arsenite methyltransferase, partial [Mycobacterium sp.]|nr:arsenite methyltransferase [Mycobacterium sp.]
PAEPDVSNGYLDLLGTTADGDVAKNNGAIQAAWASTIGSFVYDNAQALARRFIAAWQLPIDWLDVPQGGVVLDVGAGPGSITATLGHAAGPDGLALGVDVSEPMLARAVRAAAAPQVGFLRADAQRLPFRDQSFDVAVSIAVFQLIPDPAAALSEIARVLKPGGRLAVMIPTLRPPVNVWRALPTGGAHVFGEDEVGDLVESHGFTSVRVKSVGTFQWVRGKRS